VKQQLLTAFPATLLLCACATNPYGSSPDAGTRTMYGAAAGAVVGALAGSAVGADPLSGAGIGAIAGGAIGAAVPGTVFQGRQYYRDTRGYCYYVDRRGEPHYNYKVRC
jgi:uncharacterized protein YcfJ